MPPCLFKKWLCLPLGDCWFLASIGALTFQDDILEQVVHLEQSFEEDYCGLFHFKVTGEDSSPKVSVYSKMLVASVSE